MGEVLGLHLLDWLAILSYLAAMAAIGVWTILRIKDTSDFFIGGRQFGKVFMVFFSFGAGTSGNDAVAVAAKTFTNGVSGIWYQFLWLFATPFYWIIAPAFRRMRAITTGDFFEYRFDSSTAALYTVVGITQLTVNMGVLLRGSSATIDAVTGGAIPWGWAIAIMTVLFVFYGVAGGLAAAIITDFIQGILTVILSFIILPFAWHAVGGMVGMRANIADESMFSLVAPGEINYFHVAMFALSALVGIVTQPHIMGVCAAGRDEMDGRVGFTGGNLLKRVCTVAWMLTGLAAVVALADVPGLEPDDVFGTMARTYLTAVMPGLLGLFIAALLASIMSSCDAFMVSSSGLFTQNFYRRYIVTDRPEAHYVQVGRAASLVIVCCSVLFAFGWSDVPTALEWFFKIQAVMGAAFWLGLLWRRTTVAGVWAGTLGAIVVLIGTSDFISLGNDAAGTPMHLWSFNERFAQHLPAVMLWDGDFRVSWQIFFQLLASFGLCILVSLLTPRVPEAKLERFYGCLRTPVQGNEPHLGPFTLPPGVTPPPPRKLINHPDIEIPMPSAVGMAGFITVWILVFLFIAAVYGIVGMGA